ncbi:MAG TPA: hypothetical protein VMH23_12030 [Bacteroidota bacterium]|nr:hypothetical protein [Bacteroidota bacterium]
MRFLTNHIDHVRILRDRMAHAAVVLVVAAGFLSMPARAQENSDCLGCHNDKSLEGSSGAKKFSVFVDEKKFGESIHASLKCIACHEDLAGKDLPHDPGVKPVRCGTCHASEEALHSKSLHGKAVARGDQLAPKCKDCHGNHNILPAKDPRSPISALQVPFLCGKCHKEGSPVSLQRTIHQDHILENFSESIHGQALFQKGLIVAPNCASCHTPHSILPHTDPASSISRANISKTCTKCHAQIEIVHRKVIRGELWEKQAHVLPACVDCHQPHKIRKVFYTQGMADQDCLRCHQNKNLKSSKDGRSLFVAGDQLGFSRHSKVSCSQCHSEVSVSHVRPCETITKKVDCTSCHAEIGQQYQVSTHGRLVAKNDPNGPSCKECHGTHDVKGKLSPDSPTFPTNIPALCAKCHREGNKAAVRYTGGQHEIIEHYTESIHGKGLMKSGLTVTATCTNCHTPHSILPKSDTLSSVNPRNVPQTCGRCHHGIEEQFESSIHAQQVGKTDKPLPVCSDCHTAHTIRRVDATGFKLEIMTQCGRCHEAIAKTYFDTYHGKVSQLGYTKTAKCYDCHGAHDILAVTDPRSHLSRENVVATCQKCHSGATRRFAGYLTHATHHDPQKYPFLFWTFWGMTSLLIGTFFIGGVHTLLWLPRALKMQRDRRKKSGSKDEGEKREDGTSDRA